MTLYIAKGYYRAVDEPGIDGTIRHLVVTPDGKVCLDDSSTHDAAVRAASELNRKRIIARDYEQHTGDAA